MNPDLSNELNRIKLNLDNLPNANYRLRAWCHSAGIRDPQAMSRNRLLWTLNDQQVIALDRILTNLSGAK